MNADEQRALFSGFLDELDKIAACKDNMQTKTRSGRRPLHVSTMLKKEKDGTLFKYTKESKGYGEEVAEPAKSGDSPSRDGADVGQGTVHRTEFANDLRATIPSGGAMFSHETGPLPRY